MTPPLRQLLRDELSAAIKSRDEVAVSALRSTLGAVDNAEAVAVPAEHHAALPIELTPTGTGATEAPRRQLSDRDVADLVRAEIAERAAAARHYEAAGKARRGARLRAEAQVLATVLAAAGFPG